MGLQFERALGIVRQTLPYVLYRMLIYGLLCVCVVIYLLFLALIGVIFGSGAFWVLFVISVLMAVTGGVGSFLSEYLFSRHRAGHVALITEIIAEGQLPIGISQMKWARGRVLHYFHGPGLLPEVRRLIHDILRAIHGALVDTGSALPLTGVEGNSTLTQRIAGLSQRYVEEAAIAYVFRTRDENVFEAARTSLLLYGQCWRTVLGHAVTLTLLSYGFAIVSCVVFLLPLGILAEMMPDEWIIMRFALFAVGVFMGFCAKWALFDPVASAATILTFFGESDISTPDPEWETRLEAAAPAYAELRAKAAEKAAESDIHAEARRPRARRTPKQE
jgi:hypothetical protein